MLTFETIPDVIDFRFPRKHTKDRFWVNSPIKLSDEIGNRVRQLIIWCAVQSYWYYVLARPAYSDEDFDFVKNYINEMHRDFPLETKITHDVNLYWGRTPCHFPEYVRRVFDIEAWYRRETSGPLRTPTEQRLIDMEESRSVRKVK
jgi:hypothetical protein